MNTAVKIHQFSYAHRIYQHQGKCDNLHGHNGRISFKISSDDLDKLGMVIDFGQIKKTLCKWIDDNWDHKCLIYENDPLKLTLHYVKGLVVVPFNPTAENIANYLLNVVGPKVLSNGFELTEVVFKESKENYVRITNK